MTEPRGTVAIEVGGTLRGWASFPDELPEFDPDGAPDRPDELFRAWLVEAGSVEFWQARHDRRHVRPRYRRADRGWARERLWP